MLVQLARYSLVGATNTLITFLAYLTLVTLGVDYLLASALGYLLGAANSYILNRNWTFPARGSGHRRTLWRFAAVQALGIGANLGLIFALVHALAVAKAPAQVLVTPLVLGLTFVLSRLWAFAAGGLATVHASDLR